MLQLITENYQEILFNTARIFSSVFEIILGFLLVNNFFSPKLKKKALDILPFVVTAGIVIFLQEYRSAGVFKYIAEYSLLILVLLFLYDGKLKSKILGCIVFAVLVFASAGLASFACSYIGRRFGIAAAQSSPFAELLRLAVSNVFMIIGSVIISTAGKKNPHADTSMSLWIALLSVPVVTLLTFSVYQYYIENFQQDSRILNYTLISCMGLLFVNVLVFVLFRRLQHQMTEKRDTDMLTSQLALQEESIGNLETAYNRTRSFRHDIKNHILLMNMLAEQGKYEELKSYLKDMSGVIDESSYVRISGISAVDAILNEKLYEAQSKNITTSYDVVNLDKNRVKPLDMCIILSNALDNAIEANEKIGDADKRYIKLKIHGNETFSVVSVSNPTLGAPKKSGGNTFLTTKADADNHGFGLKSIENTVRKYKGEMLCKCEEGVFTLVVRLNRVTE